MATMIFYIALFIGSGVAGVFALADELDLYWTRMEQARKADWDVKMHERVWGE